MRHNADFHHAILGMIAAVSCNHNNDVILAGLSSFIYRPIRRLGMDPELVFELFKYGVTIIDLQLGRNDLHIFYMPSL